MRNQSQAITFCSKLRYHSYFARTSRAVALMKPMLTWKFFQHIADREGLLREVKAIWIQVEQMENHSKLA